MQLYKGSRYQGAADAGAAAKDSCMSQQTHGQALAALLQPAGFWTPGSVQARVQECMSAGRA